MIPVVETIDLRRTYGTGQGLVSALRSATSELFAGEQVALMGPSGSGKSTLLHLLAGIDHPTSGTIRWPLFEINGATPTLRPGPVGIVFQYPSLLPPLTVVENVALPLLLASRAETESMMLAHKALAVLDMESLANKLPEELSGGQAQRVAIARVLATGSKLILADEPTGQLDRTTATQVIDVLLAAATVSGATLLISTHDEAVARRCAIRWTMAEGVLDAPSIKTSTAAMSSSC